MASSYCTLTHCHNLQLPQLLLLSCPLVSLSLSILVMCSSCLECADITYSKPLRRFLSSKQSHKLHFRHVYHPDNPVLLISRLTPGRLWSQVKIALQSGKPPVSQRGPGSAFPVLVPLLQAPTLRNALVTEALIEDLAGFLACCTALGAETSSPAPQSEFQVSD